MTFLNDSVNENIRKTLRPALLIVNPVSGKKLILRHLCDVICSLTDGGYLVTVMVTEKRGDACEFVKRYGRDFALVCCTGGDGTLNEVITGLASEEIHVPLGYIPCGSTNDFAASHSLALSIPEAVSNIISCRQTRYDIGRFGSKYFTYVAAFGAFSWLSYTTDQNLKNVLGHTAYIIDAIKDLYKIRPYHLRITSNGVTYEDDYIFGAVCNSLSIAGAIELPKDIIDTADGLFEVLLIRMPETIFDLDTIIHGLLTQNYSNPFIKFFQTAAVDIENEPGLIWTLDGESSGEIERVHIEPIPGFLNLQG